MVKRTENVDAVIGGNIKTARVAAGLSQEQLADKITEVSGQPMHQQTVLKIEQGSRPVRYTEAAAIAKVLSVPLVTFTDGTTGEVAMSATRKRLEKAVLQVHEGVGSMLTGYREYLESVLELQKAYGSAVQAGVVSEPEVDAVQAVVDADYSPLGETHDAIMEGADEMVTAFGWGR